MWAPPLSRMLNYLMQSALFVNHNLEVLYHRVEVLQTVIKDDRKRRKFNPFWACAGPVGELPAQGWILWPVRTQGSQASPGLQGYQVSILVNGQWVTWITVGNGEQTMIDEEKMEVGLPRPVIFTGILHKQSVRRTNNDRWGENLLGLPRPVIPAPGFISHAFYVNTLPD